MVNFDKDLLFLYSENARTKIRDLSKLLSRSPQGLKYSLKVMEKEELLGETYTIFDYSYFGLILFRIYFKGGYLSERDKEVILSKLNQNPYIVTIYELSGEFDLVLEMESPNPSRFNKEFKKLVSLFPTFNHYKVVLNLVTHIYPRNYLLSLKEPIVHLHPEIIIGGDRGVEPFNENELSIVHNLLQHPKLRMTALAKASGMNVKTVKTTLKHLQKRRIVRGCKHIIDPDKLDLYRFRVFLKLHNLSPEREEEFLDFLLKTREIVQLNKTVGDWDMEVDLESLDRNRIRQLALQLREDFKEIIEDFNVIEFYKYYKKSYLPSYLFEGEENSI